MENEMNHIMKMFFEPHGISEKNDKVKTLRAKLYCLELMNKNTTIEKIKNSFGYRICEGHLPKKIMSDEYIHEIINN